MAPSARRRRASACCAAVNFRGRPICWPRFCARLRPSAVRVRIKSRSTSARPPRTANHQAPGAGAGVGPRFRQGSKLRLGVHDLLDDGEQVEGAPRQPVNARHCHHVAGREVFEHVEKLASVVMCARHLLALNLGASRAAKLLKLAVAHLAVGADAAIADEPVFPGEF